MPTGAYRRATARLGFAVERRSSPHLTQELAADAFLGGLLVGQHAARSRDDRDAHPAHHLRQVGVLDVLAPAGTADALHADDRARAIAAVLEYERQRARELGLHRETVDIALVLEDLGDAHLDLGQRHVGSSMAREDRIVDAAQHVGDGIGRHSVLSLPARFRDPGDLTAECKVTQTDAAQLELAIVRTRAAALFAAVAIPNLKLRFLFHFREATRASHLSLLFPERHTEGREQSAAVFVITGGGAERHAQAFDLVDLVVVDLGEHDLLAHPE